MVQEEKKGIHIFRFYNRLNMRDQYKWMGIMNLLVFFPQLIILLINWDMPMTVGHALELAVFSLTLHNLMELSKKIVENRYKDGE